MADTAVGATDPDIEQDATEAGQALSETWVEDQPAAREGTSPLLRLDRFTGRLDHLLTLARTQTIDIAVISLIALIDQLTAALRRAPTVTSLSQKADWVVMAAWLVQLRTRLLLPAEAPAQQVAAVDADPLQERLIALQAMHDLAGWLERRPRLGHDVFARGQPEIFGVSVDGAPAVDVIEFLWASLALFDDEPVSDTARVYRPCPLDLYDVAQARERILKRLADDPQAQPLERLLPDGLDDADGKPRLALRRRSAWSSTFVASLELARQGSVTVAQGGNFEPIAVAPV